MKKNQNMKNNATNKLNSSKSSNLRNSSKSETNELKNSKSSCSCDRMQQDSTNKFDLNDCE